MEVTPYNVEYYYVAQSINKLMDKHLGGDKSIVYDLSALDSRLEQMYGNNTPREWRLFFLHYVLMLWGGQIFPRQLDYTHWYAAAEKFQAFTYKELECGDR